jgi:tetratricopeptide (TPR) repeat protein
MIESNSKKELERKIDLYVNGQLSPEEVDELWVDLVQDDYYLDYLKTVAATKNVVEKQRKRDASIFYLNPEYRSWVATAAAAVVLLVGSMVIYTNTTLSSGSVSPLSMIEMDYYRSSDGTVLSEAESADVIMEAIVLANSGSQQEALRVLDNALASTDDGIRIVELQINAGSILYNMGNFTESIERFETATSYTMIDSLIRERAYWYLGNAYFQTNETDKAIIAFRNAYDLNGAYSRVIRTYLDALESR